MKTISKEIFDTIEDRDLTQISVCNILKCSKSALTNFKKDGIIGFNKLVKFAFLLFPDKPHSKITEWCHKLTSAENIKQAFEYSTITRNIPLLEQLLKKYRNETGIIKACVEIYSVIHMYMVNKIHGSELISILESAPKPKDASLNVLVKIFKCYSHFFNKRFSHMLEAAEEIKISIDKLSDRREQFMKECFNYRLSEILSPVYLHYNKLELARNHAESLINADVCAKTKSDGYYVLGMTYLKENREKSIECFRLSYDAMILTNDLFLIKEALDNLNFALLYFSGDSKESPNKLSLVAWKLKKGTIIEHLYLREDDDFVRYFNSIMDRDVNKMYDAFEAFLEETNIFFASLVAKSLVEAGENQRALRIMMNLNLKIKGVGEYEEKDLCSFSSSSDRSGIVCA